MITTSFLCAALLAKPKDVLELQSRRVQFETVLKAPKQDIGYWTVTSETLGPAGSDGLWPIGSADERYVIYTSEGADGFLMYERRHGNVARVDWYVPIVETKHLGPVLPGTVRKYLRKDGYRISPRARLKLDIRRQLAQVGTFAGYAEHPMNGWLAWVVRPDGTSTNRVPSPDALPITQDEKALVWPSLFGRK